MTELVELFGIYLFGLFFGVMVGIGLRRDDAPTEFVSGWTCRCRVFNAAKRKNCRACGMDRGARTP